MLIEPATLAAFSAVAFALVVSPGPDTMLILHRSVSGGQRVGLATVAGVQLGLVAHTLLAVFGLSLVIASSPFLFKGIAVAGSLYLGWLAVRSVRAGVLETLNKAGSTTSDGVTACRDAVLCNILNPKVMLMYLALMPNFVDLERGDVPAQLAVLGAVMILVNTVWQVPLSLAANAAGRWLGSPIVKQTVDWAAGGILAMFAVLMLYEHIF